MGATMFSRYLGTKIRSGIVALFHELHPDPIFCTTDKWKDVQEGGFLENDEFISQMVSRKLIIDTAIVDDQEFRAAEEKLLKKFSDPTILYLMTAQDCNFSCAYCPVPSIAKKYGKSVLSNADAFAGIDLWQEHIQDAYNPNTEYFVIFYGGEPLLNKPVIKASLEYLEAKRAVGELPANIRYMIATNGSLVDAEIVGLCQEYGVSVGVGLDGSASVNDMLKRYANGGGTYNMIVAAIKQLVSAGIVVHVSMSITPFNMDQIDHHANLLAELGVSGFGLNFLKGRLLVELVGTEGLQDYYVRAAQAVIKNARNSTAPGFEYQFAKKLSAFETGNFFPVDCTCYGNQLVIQPDGEISNCPFEKTMLGQVGKVGLDFRIWNQPIVRQWRTRLPLYHPGDAKALYGGGCACGTRGIKGDALAVDDSARIFAEEALDELIWRRYK